MSVTNTDPKAIDWFLEHAVERVLPDAASFKARLLKGESAARKRLTRDEVLANLKDYKTQLAPFLKFDGENPVQIRFNSEWLAKMSFSDVVELAAHFTVQQMMERDMFEKRVEEGKPVYLHEFMYPLMQGYDSVAMEVDLEVGGNDQTFNMLAGRTLLREMKGKEKFVMSCKLLADPTGKKMGKSEGNMISLADSAEDAYGKVMSWSDGMIMPGFEVMTSLTGDLALEATELASRRSLIESGQNPMTLKKELAHRVTANCFGVEAADRAAAHFAHVHQDGALPETMFEVMATAPAMLLIDALMLGELVDSKTDARRQIEQGAVKVGGTVITDVKAEIMIPAEGVVIQKGKRGFAKLTR